MLSSSPPGSARSFAFTSSPARDTSSIASSPPPATPKDSPRQNHLYENALCLEAPSEECDIEHVNLEASSQTINIVIGQTVHIGRKLKKLEERIRSESSNWNTPTTLVTIPKAAKHASRHHCTLTLSKAENGLRLVIAVLGQNGMQLEGVKIPCGEKQVEVPDRGIVTLGFYTDFEVNVMCEAIQTQHVTKQVVREATEQLPIIPTSEATLGLDLEMDLEDEEDAGAEEDQQQSHVLAEEVKPVRRSQPVKLESAPSSPMAPLTASQSSSKRRQAS